MTSNTTPSKDNISFINGLLISATTDGCLADAAGESSAAFAYRGGICRRKHGRTAWRYRNPVPPQRWHLTTLSPFLSSPLPSQFLHFCFFLMLGPFWLDMTLLPWRRMTPRARM